MNFSLVIVSYKTKDLLKECLQSYTTQIKESADEIIVVDNDSQDGSVEMVKEYFPGVRVLANDFNAGFSKGCNLGWKNSKNDFIIFSNTDINIPEGFFDKLRLECKSIKDWDIMSPELRSPDKSLIQASWSYELSFWGEFFSMFFSPDRVAKIPFMNYLTVKRQSKVREVDLVAGACMIAKKQFLQTVNGFDENFELYFEDADLCYQCRKIGGRVIFNPNIFVFHGLGKSGEGMSRKISFIYRQSQIYYYRKNNGFLQLQLLKIYLLFKWFIFKGLLKNKKDRSIFLDIIRENKRFSLTDNF